MKNLILNPFYILTFSIGLYIGCSPVKFTADPNFNKCQNFTQTCITVGDIDYFDYSQSIQGETVDILFVDDNSASMSEDQRNLGNRFSFLLARLRAKNINYRIGVITTDVSASINNPKRPVNMNGLLQDGNLIQFASGEYFLTPMSPNPEILFSQAIQRSETLNCETWMRSPEATSMRASNNNAGFEAAYKQHCPSGDERAVYAVNLLLKKNPASFLRPQTPLSVIIISDENNRSFGHVRTNQASMYDSFALEINDLPKTLISNFYTLNGNSKKLTVHALVIKTGDLSCLNQQKSQLGASTDGNFGTNYEELAMETDGYIGNICSPDYSYELGEIATNIVERLDNIAIACTNPQNLVVTLTPHDPTLGYDVRNKSIFFSKNIPSGTKVNLKYSCQKL
jgi:hypothetical protein